MPKKTSFLQPNAAISKFKGVLILKGIFSKYVIPTYAYDLRTKFQVSSITSSQCGPLKNPARLGLKGAYINAYILR